MTSKADEKRIRPRLSHFIFITLIFMAIALVYVWFHIKITKLNYQIASEISVRDRLLEENRRLKVEVTTLKAPQRIEKIARDKLEMYFPDKDQVIFVK
jgi:cell division protein FtsL